MQTANTGIRRLAVASFALLFAVSSDAVARGGFGGGGGGFGGGKSRSRREPRW